MIIISWYWYSTHESKKIVSDNLHCTKLPRIMRFHNQMSLTWIVTRPAWRAQTFTSSNIDTRNDSEASCKARMAVLWNRSLGHSFPATSFTKRWKGSFLINKSVDFWYLRISRRATVPRRKRRGLRTPPRDGSPILSPCRVLYRPRGAFPPVLIPACCFVRAMITSTGDGWVFFLGSSHRENKKWRSRPKTKVFQHIKTVYPG